MTWCGERSRKSEYIFENLQKVCDMLPVTSKFWTPHSILTYPNSLCCQLTASQDVAIHAQRHAESDLVSPHVTPPELVVHLYRWISETLQTVATPIRGVVSGLVGSDIAIIHATSSVCWAFKVSVICMAWCKPTWRKSPCSIGNTSSFMEFMVHCSQLYLFTGVHLKCLKANNIVKKPLFCCRSSAHFMVQLFHAVSPSSPLIYIHRSTASSALGQDHLNLVLQVL